MKLKRFNNIVVFNSYTISIKMSFYFVFDTETNGLPTRNKRDSTGKGDNFNNVYLYQIAYYKYDKDLNEYSRLNLYINLEDYSVFNYIDKNKITEEILRTKGKKINKVLDFLNKVLDDVCLLVAHNLSFDISVLLTECVRHNKHDLYHKLLTIPKFDTMRYAGSMALKVVNRIMPSQEKTYNTIFKNNYTSLHDALDDTKHCGEIFKYLFNKWDNVLCYGGKCKGISYFERVKNENGFIERKTYSNDIIIYLKNKDKYFQNKNTNNDIQIDFTAYNQNWFTDYLNYYMFNYCYKHGGKIIVKYSDNIKDYKFSFKGKKVSLHKSKDKNDDINNCNNNCDSDLDLNCKESNSNNYENSNEIIID